METPHFQQLIARYHERQYSQWLIISCIVFLITCITIAGISTKQLVDYTYLKKHHAILLSQNERSKKAWNIHQQLTKQQKQLAEQIAHFDSCSPATALTIISTALPTSLYLTSIKISDRVTLQGFSSELTDVAVFAKQLGEEGFQAAVEESVHEAGGVRFEIHAQQAQ